MNERKKQLQELIDCANEIIAACNNALLSDVALKEKIAAVEARIREIAGERVSRTVAERLALGDVLLHGKPSERFIAIEATGFEDERCAKIAEIMRDLYTEGKAIDPVTIAEKMGDEADLGLLSSLMDDIQ